MNINTLSPTDSDEVLVAQTLHGNRDAFALIVQRYQSLVCSLAYNATGSLAQSEDLAQETFLAAWRQLAALREPSKLRPWLCRIARNISCDALKKEGRSPLSLSDPIEAADDSAARDPSPPDQAISREEEAIMWRSLERIPDSFREPLILFYREHHSVARVAEALDLSEDAVKQRLTRGRKLLHEQVLAFVEGALQRTSPGPAFTQGVLLALPGMTATSTSLLSSATAKGAAAGLLKLCGGVFLIFAGNYAGYRAGLAQATSEPERIFIKRFYARLLAACIGYSLLLYLVIFIGVNYAKPHPLLFHGMVSLMVAASLLTFAAFAIWARRNGRQLLTLQKAGGSPQFSAPAWEYRSPAMFLGLPLVHIRVGGRGPANTRVVKAWFAAGHCAVGGLFAFGGMAIAPLSMGGCSIGLISWGGMAVGLLAVSGFAIGAWSIGGLALGWKAMGGGAIAWKAAYGSLAVAHDFAVGVIAQAADANTASASAYVHSSPFFQGGFAFCRYACLLNLLWVVPMILWWRIAARARRRTVPVALLAAATLFLSLHSTRAQPSTNIVADRFDYLVREDFFSGDQDRFHHAMKICDDALAQNPKYAPALSWKGAGDLSLAGQSFRSADVQNGILLWQRGLKEMDAAVTLQPASLQVLIPRGATYLAIAQYDPAPEEAKHLLQTGVGDYEKALALQQPHLDKLSRHARGELLSGLADGWFRLGDLDKSRGYLRLIIADCPDSPYSKRAAEWLETKDPVALKQKSRALSCIGCHN